MSDCVQQKCALEVHDAEVAAQKKQGPPIVVTEPEEPVRGRKHAGSDTSLTGGSPQTVKGPQGGQASAGAQGSHGRLSVGRGDLDEAIRSMRDGKRRVRTQRPLSKIFFDGSSHGRRQSRAIS